MPNAVRNARAIPATGTKSDGFAAKRGKGFRPALYFREKNPLSGLDLTRFSAIIYRGKEAKALGAFAKFRKWNGNYPNADRTIEEFYKRTGKRAKR